MSVIRATFNAGNTSYSAPMQLPGEIGSIHRFQSNVNLEDIGLPVSCVLKINIIGDEPVIFLVTENG